MPRFLLATEGPVDEKEEGERMRANDDFSLPLGRPFPEIYPRRSPHFRGLRGFDPIERETLLNICLYIPEGGAAPLGLRTGDGLAMRADAEGRMARGGNPVGNTGMASSSSGDAKTPV